MCTYFLFLLLQLGMSFSIGCQLSLLQSRGHYCKTKTKNTNLCVRLPGVEPGSIAWKAIILTVGLQTPMWLCAPNKNFCSLVSHFQIWRMEEKYTHFLVFTISELNPLKS